MMYKENLFLKTQGYESNININTNTYADGLYFIEINDGLNQIFKKINVQH